MSPIIKLYLKVLFLLGLSFSAGLTIFHMFLGEEFSLFKFVFLFLFFGGFMSLILVTKHKNRLSKLGVSDYTDTNLKVIQSTSIVTSLNPEEFSKKLQSDSVVGKMSMNQKENAIELNSNVTWFSWGEVINIHSKELASDKYEYSVVSRPKLKSTILDYGKNLENIMAIESALESAS